MRALLAAEPAVARRLVCLALRQASHACEAQYHREPGGAIRLTRDGVETREQGVADCFDALLALRQVPDQVLADLGKALAT